MVTIDIERPGDWHAREALLDRTMGYERFLKPSQLLRDGRLAAAGLSFVAREHGTILGSVRLWDVVAGDRPALLLGPLAVAPETQGRGIGSRLMRRAVTRAASLGHGAIILVGDAPYYARFGFDAALTQNLVMPAPVDPTRFVALELRAGALAGAAGAMLPAGMPIVPAQVAMEQSALAA